jgi:wyosine [tRNA(Phe)-imidazoG37] synthetase (radical SAM superfamily)
MVIWEVRIISQPFPRMPLPTGPLTVQNHRRDSVGMTYVYPVVSRRAGGVSVGINLNPNNACNWHCIYCQVPGLRRGGPPPIDLQQLDREFADLLAQLYHGDFLERHAPPEARRVVDVAFSGNGEPTSAAEFAAAVAQVGHRLDQMGLAEPPRLRLITNGSLLGRETVRHGIALLGQRGGEVWFKIDAVGAEAMRRINGAALQPETVLRRLQQCGARCETWVQTCLFALDGAPPAAGVLADYGDFLVKARESLGGVHLYGLARPSCQQEASRLSALPADWLEAQAAYIRKKTGLPVRVSP